MDYVTQLRINKAKQLMGQGNERIREIARQVGFSDEYYFSRKFKQQQGVAPTVYMKSRRHRVATYHTAITGQLLALQTISSAAPLDPKWSAYYRQKYAGDIPVHLRDPFDATNWMANREALRRFGPDLIITSDYLDHAVKQELGDMANALFVPWKEKDWRVHLQMIGEFLGRNKEAEQWLVAYDQKAAAARETVRWAVGDDTLLMVYINQATLYACGSQRTGSTGCKRRGGDSGAFEADCGHFRHFRGTADFGPYAGCHCQHGLVRPRKPAAVRARQAEGFQNRRLLHDGYDQHRGRDVGGA
ncbi:AraC family transcriptional regulator [Brevibacillus agri]|uniref:AraC family transcriptional regulator n=1 Tax=Brevibacillus agri TaxID=51101 RepID=UPI003D708A3C